MKYKQVSAISGRARVNIEISWYESNIKELSSLIHRSSFARSFNRSDGMYGAFFLSRFHRSYNDPSHYNEGCFIFRINCHPLSRRAHTRKGISKRI